MTSPRTPVPGVVIVTGAAGGIGGAVATKVLAAGWRAVLVDLADPHDAVPDGCTWISGDVTSEADAKQAVTAATKLGPLLGLVNVAGIRDYRPFLEVDADILRRHVDVNLIGPALWMREVARAITSAGTSGSIVNITSIMAHTAVAQNAAYCASKAGLLGLSRAAAIDLAPHQIRVNCVAPGPTDTPMLRGGSVVPSNVLARMGLGRLALPDDIADVVTFLLFDASRFVTGTTVTVDGGYLAC